VGERSATYPRFIRPAFTSGGSGAASPTNPEEVQAFCKSGLEASPGQPGFLDRALA